VRNTAFCERKSPEVGISPGLKQLTVTLERFADSRRLSSWVLPGREHGFRSQVRIAQFVRSCLEDGREEGDAQTRENVAHQAWVRRLVRLIITAPVVDDHVHGRSRQWG
jgi:hypothetical protein